MEIISTREEIATKINQFKYQGKTVGFVPTMGALHQGHLSLVKASKQENGITVASIFVNPTQFNNQTDLERYPGNLEQDALLLEKHGCDFIFAPGVDEMYPEEDNRSFDFGNLDRTMEGSFRPGHFAGVAKIVTKLFDCIPANNAYFGEKDFQQLAIIRYVVKKFNYPINIVACPTIREENGLAMSSRNLLLSEKARQRAAIIFETMQQVKKNAREMPFTRLKQEAIEKLNNAGHLEVEYLEIADENTLEPLQDWQKGARVFVAAHLDGVRLIDNLSI